ncbi:hypothetical protein CR513_10920, partial [Mucuna pruriens]
MKSSRLKMIWLEEHFGDVDKHAHNMLQMLRLTRAYILRMMGGMFFPYHFGVFTNNDVADIVGAQLHGTHFFVLDLINILNHLLVNPLQHESNNDQLHNLPQYCLVGSEVWISVYLLIIGSSITILFVTIFLRTIHTRVLNLSTWCGTNNTPDNGLAIWVLKRLMLDTFSLEGMMKQLSHCLQDFGEIDRITSAALALDTTSIQIPNVPPTSRIDNIRARRREGKGLQRHCTIVEHQPLELPLPPTEPSE